MDGSNHSSFSRRSLRSHSPDAITSDSRRSNSDPLTPTGGSPKLSGRNSVNGRRILISFTETDAPEAAPDLNIKRAMSAESDGSGPFSVVHDLPEFESKPTSFKPQRRPSSGSSHSTNSKTLSASVLKLGALGVGKSLEVKSAGAGKTIFSNINILCHG